MADKVWPSSGPKSVNVVHAVWFNEKTKHVHVTIDAGIPGTDGAHWSYSRNTDPKKYAIYKAILQDQGRWPEDQE